MVRIANVAPANTIPAAIALPLSAPSLPGPASLPVARAVLVHCNRGHNRSPTLVLAFLVHFGLTLREAYRHVLCARPHIDPLSPYRHGLRNLEVQLRGKCSVEAEEVFGLHISELLAGRDDRFSEQTFVDALQIRQEGIDALLGEENRWSVPRVDEPHSETRSRASSMATTHAIQRSVLTSVVKTPERDYEYCIPTVERTALPIAVAVSFTESGLHSLESGLHSHSQVATAASTSNPPKHSKPNRPPPEKPATALRLMLPAG